MSCMLMQGYAKYQAVFALARQLRSADAASGLAAHSHGHAYMYSATRVNADPERNNATLTQYTCAGPADKALQHFERLGHKCPERHNPAEFLADLISVDYASSEAQASSR